MLNISGTFGIYNVNDLMEKNVKLEGEYGIKAIKDERNYKELDETIHCQSVFRSGNVFFRHNIEDIDKLILLFSEYTCKDIDGIEKCTSKPVQLMGGTICPTRKRLFRLKSKEFVAFGRYIFGYHANHVRIVRNGKNAELTESDSASDIDSDSDFDCDSRIDRESSISENQIILAAPPRDGYWTDDYVYSFMIFDHETGILDAFGLYR